MKARRLSRVVAGLCVLATASVGILATGTAGAASDPSDQFDNLKPIKAPSPCKNDPGVTDTEIKIGTIIADVGALRAVLRAGARRHQGPGREGQRRG